MKQFIYTFLLLVSLFGCTANGGVSVATDPRSFLSSYPIGEDQAAVLSRMGGPDSQTQAQDFDVWTYKIGEGYGLRRWNFFFRDGLVFDVQYNDQGPYNGLTARKLQGLN